MPAFLELLLPSLEVYPLADLACLADSHPQPLEPLVARHLASRQHLDQLAFVVAQMAEQSLDAESA